MSIKLRWAMYADCAFFVANYLRRILDVKMPKNLKKYAQKSQKVISEVLYPFFEKISSSRVLEFHSFWM